MEWGGRGQGVVGGGGRRWVVAREKTTKGHRKGGGGEGGGGVGGRGVELGSLGGVSSGRLVEGGCVVVLVTPGSGVVGAGWGEAT